MKGMILQVADENKQAEKEALKAQKKAEKEALKAKKERIKQSKPKKSDKGNIFVRMGRAIKKFFKDFKGTCKKVIWPDRKTVLKNTLIVFVTVLIVGVGIWIVDFCFTKGIRLVQDGIEESVSVRDEEAAEEEALSLEAEQNAASDSDDSAENADSGDASAEGASGEDNGAGDAVAE